MLTSYFIAFTKARSPGLIINETTGTVFHQKIGTIQSIALEFFYQLFLKQLRNFSSNQPSCYMTLSAIGGIVPLKPYNPPKFHYCSAIDAKCLQFLLHFRQSMMLYAFKERWRFCQGNPIL